MNIEIKPIQKEELPILINLVKMYSYEWSQYNGIDVDEKGIYPFEPYVHFYFEKPNRYAYFVRVDNILAGFALIDNDFQVDKTSNYSMGEFFVMYKYRKLGLGTKLATTLFDQFPGKWEVGFHPKNITSCYFWKKVIETYSNHSAKLYENVEHFIYQDGTHGSVYCFDSSKK